MNFNKIGLLVLLVCVGNIYGANKPPALKSQLVEIQPRAWYSQQYDAWSEFLANSDQNVTAKDWMNYFNAARFSRQPSAVLTEISRQISENYPESAESEYAQFIVKQWSPEGIENLRNAFQLAPKQSAWEAELMMLAEYDFDFEKRGQVGALLLRSGTISSSLLNYCYNVLMSVSDNSILFVNGSPTTIPLWILQDEMQVRRDIKILNLDLASNRQYLEKWLAKHNLNYDKGEDVKEILIQLPESNTDVDFFYGLTLPDVMLDEFKEQLYVVGLASQRKTTSLQHYETLRDNIENKFLLDYLTVDFSGEPKTATGRAYESNYILPFILLKEYYDELGELDLSARWEELILKLAERSQIKNRVSLLMNRNSARKQPAAFSKVDIEVKTWDKRMKQIKDNLYASEIETQNRDYWFYLNYLKENGYEDLYEKSLPKTRTSKSDGIAASFLENYNYSPANYIRYYTNDKKIKKGGDYLDYPALDISHEAAKAYCEWLTAQYNVQEDREYTKVRFRLPTQDEWSVAALGYKNFTTWNVDDITVKAWGPEDWSDKKGTIRKNENLKEYNVGRDNILYPWWYPNIKFASTVVNSKGCYLANVKVPNEITCAGGTKGDGFALMSPVATYFANYMGLYDVIGNVAEMTDIDGVAMGGSWNHAAEESTIKSVNKYDTSDIRVGFRPFMEVVEK